MSALAQPVADAAAGDRLARRNALVLAVTQALAGGNSTVLVATAGIVGTMLAPDKSLATLPISIYVLGMWMGTLPLGALARRLGRRDALQIGTVCGVLTGLICCVAVLQGSFLLLNVGAVFSGLYASAHQSYRFAAADTASEAFRPKAISWVLFGGVVAGVVGPQLVIVTQDLWPPYLFAATYIGQAALALISAGVLMFMNIPKPPARSAAGDGRPLGEIAKQPRFVVAVACGVATYSMMNLVMTSAPLAMVMCNHSVTDATLGLQWHVLGMYAPSFATGALMSRFGLERITGAGLALIIVSAVIGIAGIFALAFLDRSCPARRGLEFRVHRRDHHGDPLPSAERTQQGAGLQRFSRLRLDGDRLILLRGAVGELRMEHGERGRVPGGAGGNCAARLGRPARPQAGRVMPATTVSFDRRSMGLIPLRARAHDSDRGRDAHNAAAPTSR